MADGADASVAEPVLLDGKYVLGRLLGSGAFSWVFEATHATVDGLEYAVKVLRLEHAGSADLERRFNNEVRTLAVMKSPYTVRVNDAGRTADGNPYLVMEKLVGVTLRDLVIAEGTLHPLDAARFALDVLRGLDSAHKAGVVHRDLKPSNIFIVEEGPDGRAGAKIIDFGIAKILGTSWLREPEHESTVDATPCTPNYAAPEQLHQAPSPQSDLYALGHVLAFALAGEAPYAGTGSFAVIGKHLGPEPVPLAREVTESALGPFIAKACEKSQDARWRSAAEMIDALIPIIASMESLFPNLPAPKLPARLNFGGSGDFTAPGTWSMMSLPGPTRSERRQKPSSNVPSDSTTPQVHVTTGTSRTTAVGVGVAVLIALAALVAAIKPSAEPEPAGPVAAIEPDVEADAADPAAAPPTPEELAGAVTAARSRVAGAAAVPNANAWSVSVGGGGGIARLVVDGVASADRALPVDRVFGPADRPIDVVVEREGGELRRTVAQVGAVTMTDLRIRAPRANEPPSAPTPTPGGLRPVNRSDDDD